MDYNWLLYNIIGTRTWKTMKCNNKLCINVYFIIQKITKNLRTKSQTKTKQRLSLKQITALIPLPTQKLNWIVSL